MASSEQYSAVENEEGDNGPSCLDKVIACPGNTLHLLHHTDEDNGTHYFCLLTLTLWCQLTCFLTGLWLISGLFWYMCFYFAKVWPMKALYAFLICCGAFTLLFIVLMAIDKDEEDGVSASMGCSEAQLKKHISIQMSGDMNWDNFGTAWHIVHKISLHDDNASETSDQLIKGVCQRLHYLNTEPRWANEITTTVANPRLSTAPKSDGDVEEKESKEVVDENQSVTVHN